METGTIVVIAVVALGLAFEFVNGFHDAANAIARDTPRPRNGEDAKSPATIAVWMIGKWTM